MLDTISVKSLFWHPQFSKKKGCIMQYTRRTEFITVGTARVVSRQVFEARCQNPKCGKEFTSKTRARKFCSDWCGAQARAH